MEKTHVVDSLLRSAGMYPIEAKHDLRVRVLMIGPREAAALLAANADNRPIRQGRVKFYAKVMRQGGWMLTHQGIAFSKGGQGQDLQHRLLAIIDAGVTIPMMVTEGLEDSAFEAIDQHERRSISDALRIDKGLVECAKFFLVLRGGIGNTWPSLMEVQEAAGTIAAAYDALMSECNSRRAIFASVPVRCAAICLAIERPSVAATVFSTYRNLVLLRTEHWSPVMHAFGRQERSGTLSTHGAAHRVDLFARACIALDPLRQSQTRIQLDAASVSKATQVRARKIVGDPEAVRNEAESMTQRDVQTIKQRAAA